MRAVVIGAGASGIAAGLSLLESGVDVTVIEAAERPGGAIRSHREAGWLFEDGPNSVLDSDDVFRRCCEQLGVAGSIVAARPDVKVRYLFQDGALRTVPTGPGGIATTPLLSFGERLRFMKEMFVAPAPEGQEETVMAFVARRFGDGVAKKYANAVVSGIFLGDASKMSLDAAFPEVRALEREHGSLLKAAAARAPKPEGSPRRSVVSLEAGLGGFADAAVIRFGDRLRVRTHVLSLAVEAGGLVIECARDGLPERIAADAVVVATPAHGAARLLRSVAPAASEALGGIEHTSLAVVQIGFSPGAWSKIPEGFGFLAPRGQGIEALGFVFTSQVFDGRAPQGAFGASGFYGGPLAGAPLRLSDPEITDVAVRDLARAFGDSKTPRPAFARVVRWNDVLPQHHLGHRERIASATRALRAAHPRIVLAGNYLAGSSVPRSLKSGVAAATALSSGAEGSVA
jgi:protoporphyrinogen/coproporphyrinogen III oxidase